MNGNEDFKDVGPFSDDTDILIKDGMINEDTTEPNFSSVDEIFEKIGPCGRYQFLQSFLLCMLMIPMTYQILLMYFTGHSPNWKCANGTNIACNFTGEISPADVDKFNSRCSMPRYSWEYVTHRNFSFITEVRLQILICSF